MTSARAGAAGLLLMLIVGIVGLAKLAHADPPTLESVMRRLAESGGVAARFHESRRLAILEQPIETSGMLYFAPPDSLARHVLEPGESRVIVRDDRVSFRDETGVQTLELGSSEVARAMVGNVMLLMRGDLEALRAHYDVGFRVGATRTAEGERSAGGEAVGTVAAADAPAGSPAIWTLDLEPRDPLLRGMIERLRVQGRDDRLVGIETFETSGDRTQTKFSDVRVGVDFSDADRDRIFSLETNASR